MLLRQGQGVQVLTMDEAAEALTQDASIVLLDVRSRSEYLTGHLPGSLHLPMDRLDRVGELVSGPDTQIFLYCLSGARSRAAAEQLVEMGYTNVTNIGGIARWTGEIERD